MTRRAAITVLFEEVGARIASVHLRPLKGGADALAGAMFAPVDELVLGAAAPTYYRVGDRDLIVAAVTDEAAQQARFVSRRGWNNKRSAFYPGDGILALVRPTIQAPGLVDLGFPSGETLPVDLDKIAFDAGDDTWQVGIHSSGLRCFDAGEMAADAFSELLNGANEVTERSPIRELRLFIRDARQRRFMRPEYHRPGVSTEVGGADGAPILLGNTASLESLGGTAEQKDPGRVGANVWIGGLSAFAEENIAAIQIGETAKLAAVNACGRCIATGVSPKDGRQRNDFQPLIAGRRGISRVTAESNLHFGVDFAPYLGSIGLTIRAGDPVRIAWAREPLVRRD